VLECLRVFRHVGFLFSGTARGSLLPVALEEFAKLIVRLVIPSQGESHV
jgi:hypothetical protein